MRRWLRGYVPSYTLPGVDRGLRLARTTPRRNRDPRHWEWVNDLLDRRLQHMRGDR